VPDFKILSIEEMVTADLFNPATQAKSKTFSIAGKIDAIVERNGRRILIDHKSCSDSIEDPAAPYWRQLIIEAQPSHYALLKWLNGEKISEIWWDVMHKPSIKPKDITKKDRELTSRHKHYFGFPVSEWSLAEMDRTGRETLELYEYRLAHDCTSHRPNWYFQRRIVPRLDADLHEHAVEIWENAQSMLHMRERVRKGMLPPRHSGSCMQYGSPCKFLGICSGYDTPDSNKWIVKEQVHSELPIVEGDGRDILTNSRIRCYQVCPRKHYYQYEMGIERTVDEEREALYFGTLFHLALEAYFEAWKEIGETQQ
jgi:hypothetical protein